MSTHDRPARRVTHVVHPDGSVSTRISDKYVFNWAVEQRLDLCYVADMKQQEAAETQRRLESFDRAVKAGKLLTHDRPQVLGRRIRDVRLLDPLTGRDHWIGFYTVDDQGRPLPDFGILDQDQAVARHRRYLEDHLRVLRDEAMRLAGRPRFQYTVVRWSVHKESAERAVKEFRRPGAVHRIVEAVEGQPNGSVQ